MKHTLVSIVFYIALHIGTIYAADNAQYTITSYDDTRDHDLAFTLISNKFDELATRLDGQPLNQADKQQLSHKFHTDLRNNHPASSVLKAVENSFCRIVSYKKATLAGFAEFYVNQEDYGSVRKHDGYIETMLVGNQYSDASDLLVKEVLTKLRTLGALRAMIYVVNINLGEQRAFQAALKAGFVQQNQTDDEKKHNFIRFIKDLQDQKS